MAEHDTLNDIGLLKRREIEVRIVAPLLERLAAEYGDGVYDVAGQVIADVARDQGRALAEQAGAASLPAFAAGLAAWSADGALESEVVELTDDDVGRSGRQPGTNRRAPAPARPDG